jgi:hypothetical protein
LAARLDVANLDEESKRIANVTKLKGRKSHTPDEKTKSAASDADKRMLDQLAKIHTKEGQEAYAAAQKIIGGST